MKLQFTHQTYQLDAVNAVVKVFDGQPLAKSDFALAAQASSVAYAAEGSIGNALHLDEAQILLNVQAVQKSHGLTPSTELVVSKTDKGKEQFCPLNFTLEMETGTGKTYTFIKTMYELNKVYGFKKFVIVVPSVAIREGTVKNLEVTHAHFQTDYDHVPFDFKMYDSGKINELKHFAQADALSVLVINIDSFTKDNNKINQKGERAFAPIELIQAVMPIVIVDEPQNFETDVRRRALFELNPLCTLRYSATHENPYNLLYSLNPVQAYELGLVKQIEVDGVQADDSHNEAFIELVKIEPKAKSMTARVLMDVNDKKGSAQAGVKRKEVTLKVGDDLFEKSNGREIYADGFILNNFLSDDEIEFSGGRVLRMGQRTSGLTDDVMRFQIERTVAAHFAKLRNLKPIGVKVLSLFFIDKVANYRDFAHVDEHGNPSLGKFGVWFEEAFAKYAKRHPDLIQHAVNTVHNGYFSGDKKGKGTAAKTVWVDSVERKDKDGNPKINKIDDDTYALIMRDKERLLSLEEPLQFIFSHSALREGWDNPNVFQICTLNETVSATKKRQEIGRGLRLCVNQQGERINDKRVNVLTVIPNESYEAFAKALQTEIEEDTGANFAGRIKNARAKARVSRKTLSAADEALFKSIWDKISYQTRFSVQLDTSVLIDECVDLLKDTAQYPAIKAPKIRSRKAVIVMNREGVHGVENAIADSDADSTAHTASVPDVYAYIQNRVHVSRSTIFAVLQQSGRLGELLINPQAFLDMSVAVIRRSLQTLMVKGIEYHKVNGKTYAMSLWDEPTDTYLSGIYPPNSAEHDGLTTPLSKTLMQAQPLDADKNPIDEAFDCVMVDSDIESQFASDCANDARVKFFFKLPAAFKIPTPLGNYNPDWAVVFGDGEDEPPRVYFVAETKSTLNSDELRPSEQLKIKCGERYFGLSADVVYRKTDTLKSLVDSL